MKVSVEAEMLTSHYRNAGQNNFINEDDKSFENFKCSSSDANKSKLCLRGEIRSLDSGAV